MKEIPLAMRKHVALFGETNAGKSSLFNAILGQDLAIVSEKKGTTTDPVTKAMELIPFGPIALIDTAGLGDFSYLGESRMKKTYDILRRCDLGIYVADTMDFHSGKYIDFARRCPNHILVFAKADLIKKDVKIEYKDAVYVSVKDTDSIDSLKGVIAQRLSESDDNNKSVIAGFLPKGGTVVLVISVDSEAPKERLILPQVQLIRECLDSGIKAFVVRDTELKGALSDLKQIDLVVADSQIFKTVSEIVPQSIPLTSFSMLLAKQKGNFSQLIKGVEEIDCLPENANILVLEGCTHNHTHEDIGRVKIPNLLRKKTGKHFNFDYYAGYNVPDDFLKYRLVIMCGSCMLNHKEVNSRLMLCERENIPVTNYGIMLAYLNGILDRAAQILM
jgi:[FeFe] hydrogenase H-cluster maturation GTPase HydF